MQMNLQVLGNPDKCLLGNRDKCLLGNPDKGLLARHCLD